MRRLQLKSEGLAHSLPSAASIQQDGFYQRGTILPKLIVCLGYFKRLSLTTGRKRRKSIYPVLPRVRLTPHEYVEASLAEGNSDGAGNVVHPESRHACISLRLLQKPQVGLILELSGEAGFARIVVDEEIVASYGFGFGHATSLATTQVWYVN